MEIKSLVFNPFYENTYVLWDDTLEGILVDPGCYERYEKEELIQFVESRGIRIQLIINTHCHIDHVLGNYEMKAHFGCPLWIPEHEVEVFRAVVPRASTWGIHGYTEAVVDKFIAEDDRIEFGHTALRAIFAPGHSPGHLVFFQEGEKRLIGGDVLFRESIGRTDLPGGNHAQLISSIQQKLYTLPEETVVYPGHGPTTTIGYEKTRNPFVKAQV